MYKHTVADENKNTRPTLQLKKLTPCVFAYPIISSEELTLGIVVVFETIFDFVDAERNSIFSL